jgi:hypothetical protein
MGVLPGKNLLIGIAGFCELIHILHRDNSSTMSEFLPTRGVDKRHRFFPLFTSIYRGHAKPVSYIKGEKER